jgi:hypothetical protein
VGRYLFLPVVTGTVYVIDTEVKQLSPASMVAVNDLGPGGETWTLASLTYADGRLYAHTMKEIVCIEAPANARESRHYHHDVSIRSTENPLPSCECVRTQQNSQRTAIAAANCVD